MIDLKVLFENLGPAMKGLIDIGLELEAAGEGILAQSAALLESEAKKNFIGSHARGMPHVGGSNPNVVSGALRRSITHKGPDHVGFGSWEVQVGPTTVYGRRIELGFSGSDSLGRVYHQPPFPYMRPAYESSQARLAAIAFAGWARAIGA